MKTKDRIKEEIGFEKLLLTLLVALISSLSSWFWSNKDAAPQIMVTVVFVTAIILSIISMAVFIRINLKISELDKYES